MTYIEQLIVLFRAVYTENMYALPNLNMTERIQFVYRQHEAKYIIPFFW